MQAAITEVQETATARVIAAGRRVAQAKEDAHDAKAAQIKAVAELAEVQSKMEEKVRNAVLKTSAKERERRAQALAEERGELEKQFDSVLGFFWVSKKLVRVSVACGGP